MDKVRVGIVGLGGFAHVARLPVLAGMDDVELVSCMCRTQSTVDKVKTQFGFKNGFTDLDAMIEHGDLDAVFVVTPKDTHYDIVLKLLDAGLHIFCEKPLELELSKGQRMVERAREADRVLMVGFNRRFAPVYERAKELFSESPPDVCVGFKNRPGTEYRATMENTIHIVDLVRWYCGDVVELHGYSIYDDPHYETTAASIMRFESGSIGMVLGNRTCGQWMERMELYGGGKTVVVNCPDSVTVVDHETEHTVHMGPIRMGWATLEEKMGFRQEVRHFVDCLRNGTVPRTSGEDALESHRLMDRLLRGSGLPGMEQ